MFHRYLLGVALAVASICMLNTLAQDSPRRGLDGGGSIILTSQEILEFVWVPELDIWIGKYEVTLGQFLALSKRAARNPEQFAARYITETNAMKHPAVMVSWRDANNACQVLNARFKHLLRDGYVFRLPTEAEWEAVARGREDRTYPWGDGWPPTVMADGIFPNLQGTEVISILEPPPIRYIQEYSDGWASVAPVKKSGANELGVFGLAGNVQEWCEGWFDQSKKLRLLKGSSAWTSQPAHSEVEARDARRGQPPFLGLFVWGETRNHGSMFTGFRVVIGPPVR